MTHTYKLPPAFYFDHLYRDLPSGVIERETKRAVYVRLTESEYAELLSDAKHYAFHMASAGFDGYGLIASARATVKALEKQTEAREELKMSECIWKGTWQEKTCNAPACPKHGDPNWKRDREATGSVLSSRDAEEALDPSPATGGPEKALERFTVERAHSRSEDGFLWYVVESEGGAIYCEGFIDREPAELACADLNWLWSLTEVERRAVEVTREDCGHNPDAYGLAVIAADGSAVIEYRYVYGSKSEASPEELWEDTLKEYADTGAKVIDVNGLTWSN